MPAPVEGLDIHSIDNPFTPVSADANSCPRRSLDLETLLGLKPSGTGTPHSGDIVCDRTVSNLTHSEFSRFPLDTLAKLWYSNTLTMGFSGYFDGGTDRYPDRYATDPLASHDSLRVLGKIVNASWRWGYEGRDDWNGTLQTYAGLKRFDAGEGLRTLLDFTTGCNDRGYSTRSRIYLDGAMGFLVYSGDRHLYTIGWSPSRDRTILIH